MTGGDGAGPFGKNHMADMLGMEGERTDDEHHDKRVERRFSDRAVASAAVGVVTIEVALRTLSLQFLPALVAGLGAGMAAGLVADGTTSDAIAGLLVGYLVTGLALVVGSVLNVGAPTFVLAPDYGRTLFVHGATFPLALILAWIGTMSVVTVRHHLRA